MDPNDINAFGMEWQVRDEAPQLFSDLRAPQWPEERCRMPSVSNVKRRNLRSNKELAEAAW